MNKQRGFTIIELIVVIAIIAILAAIVLVNVTVYINKAKDAAIKSDIANIALGMGSCFAAGNGATYVNCDTSTTYVPATLAADITSKSSAPTFSTSTTAFCVSAKLASDSTIYVCADSTGVTKSSTTSICAAQACPN